MAFRKIVMVLSAILGIVLAPLLVDVIGVGASFLIVGGIAAAVSIGVLMQGRRKKRIE
jgi:hypothetical protein